MVTTGVKVGFPIGENFDVEHWRRSVMIENFHNTFSCLWRSYGIFGDNSAVKKKTRRQSTRTRESDNLIFEVDMLSAVQKKNTHAHTPWPLFPFEKPKKYGWRKYEAINRSFSYDWRLVARHRPKSQLYGARTRDEVEDTRA